MPRLGSRVRVSFSAQTKKQSKRTAFLFDTTARTKRPQYAPFRGWGCKYIDREKLTTSIVGSSLVFRSTHEGWQKAILFLCASRKCPRPHTCSRCSTHTKQKQQHRPQMVGAVVCIVFRALPSAWCQFCEKGTPTVWCSI